jgi:hypothetical protein
MRASGSMLSAPQSRLLGRGVRAESAVAAHRGERGPNRPRGAQILYSYIPYNGFRARLEHRSADSRPRTGSHDADSALRLGAH